MDRRDFGRTLVGAAAGATLSSIAAVVSPAHVKDVKKIPPKTGDTPVDFEKVFPEMTSVGSGVIDFKRIFAESDKAGIKHYFVENDYPKSEFDNVQASYKYLHGLPKVV